MPFTPALPFPKARGQTLRSDDWNQLVGEVQRLDTAKIDKTGGAFSGPLRVTLPSSATPIAALSLDVQSFTTPANASNSYFLQMRDIGLGKTQFYFRGDGSLGLGTNQPTAQLHVVGPPTDPAGGTLILGPTNTTTPVAHLRLGYTADYSWIQSHGIKPLWINPIGGATTNYVTIGQNPIDIGSQHLGFLNTVTNRAEISNDTGTYKSLMILGNRSAGTSLRRITLWDEVYISSTLAIGTGITGDQGLTMRGSIFMTSQASNAFSAERLPSLPRNTVIMGGVWRSGIYFYWKDDEDKIWSIRLQGVAGTGS